MLNLCNHISLFYYISSFCHCFPFPFLFYPSLLSKKKLQGSSIEQKWSNSILLKNELCTPTLSHMGLLIGITNLHVSWEERDTIPLIVTFKWFVHIKIFVITYLSYSIFFSTLSHCFAFPFFFFPRHCRLNWRKKGRCVHIYNLQNKTKIK